MPLKDLFKKKDPEDYLELDMQGDEGGEGKLLVEVESLTNYSDSDRIQEKLRGNRILLLKISDLKGKDMAELKRTVAKIRKTCMAVEGDIAGISDDWILACPAHVKIQRKEEVTE